MCYTEISDQMFFNKHLKMWEEAAEWERHSPVEQEGSSPGREENRGGQLSTIEGHEGGDRLPIMATLRTVQWLPLSLQGRPAPSLPVCRNHKALQVRPCCPSHLPSWLATLPLCCSHAGLASSWPSTTKARSQLRAFAAVVPSAWNARPPVVHNDVTNTYVVLTVCQRQF